MFMGRAISLIISIIILILIFKLVWFILPYAIIVGVCLFIYFKYIKPLLNKNKTKKDNLYGTNYYNERNSKEDENSFNGTIIDVDYKDLDKNEDENNKKTINFNTLKL